MIYTSQSVALFLIVISGGTPSNVAVAPDLHKVGSFRSMKDCLDASKQAVVGVNKDGNANSLKYEFACIPENSQIVWGNRDRSAVTIHVRD